MDDMHNNDWSDDTDEQYLEEKELDNCVIERILQHRFHDPLMSSDSDDGCEVTFDWDEIFSANVYRPCTQEQRTSKMASDGGVVLAIKLSDDREMPALALRAYLGYDQNGVVKSTDKLLRITVMHAIELGYRHFVTASAYGTEDELGEAVMMKIENSDLIRENFFITAGLPNTHHQREEVKQAMQESLTKLRLNYVDLYLMTWPIGLNQDYTHSDVDFMETWHAMEELQRCGQAKSIGVSNFNKDQLQRLLGECSIKPVALQIEVHPQLAQKDLIEFAQSEGLIIIGYSPFGSLVPRSGTIVPGPKINDPILVEMAKKYNKTTPQIVLRWLLDRKVVPTPKSVDEERLAENINIFDFSLTAEEVEKINQYDQNVRYTLPSYWQKHPYYPFEKIEKPVADPFITSKP